MHLEASVSKVLANRRLSYTSELPKFYRNDFGHDLYCCTWRGLKCPRKINLNTQGGQLSFLSQDEECTYLSDFSAYSSANLRGSLSFLRTSTFW